MIQLFRSALNSIFTKVLLGLLIGAFAIWGIGPNLLNSYSNTAARVGDTQITAQELFNAVNQRAQALQQQGLTIDTPTLVKQYNLDYRILNELIVEASLVEHARTLELGASDETIAKEIASIEGLSLPVGGINVDLLKDQLRRNGVSLGEFQEDIREDIARRQLVTTLFNANSLPRFMAEELYKVERERRWATLVNFPASEQNDVAEPTDEELQAFFETRKGAYQTPERRSYRYLLVTPARFYGDVEVTEDQIAEEFEYRKGDYISLEERDVIEVTVPTDVVETILTAVAGGADFKETVAANTSFTVEELETRTFTEAEMAADLDQETAATVFAQSETGLAPVSDGLAGKRLLYIAEIRAGENKTLADVRDEVKAAIRDREALNLMYDFSQNLEDQVADLGALDLVAEAMKVTLASATLVDRRGINADGAVLLSDQIEQSINADAFRRDIGDELRIEPLDPRDQDKGSFVVEVMDIQAPEQRPFEDVRLELIPVVMAERRLAAAGEDANTGLDKLRAGIEPQAIIDELGGTSFDAKGLLRNAEPGKESSLAPNIRRLVFELGLGETAVEQSGDGYMVVRVNEIRPGQPDLQPTAVDAAYENLRRSFSDDIGQQYQRYLQQRFPAQINNEVVEQLFRKPVGQ